MMRDNNKGKKEGKKKKEHTRFTWFASCLCRGRSQVSTNVMNKCGTQNNS